MSVCVTASTMHVGGFMTVCVTASTMHVGGFMSVCVIAGFRLGAKSCQPVREATEQAWWAF